MKQVMSDAQMSISTGCMRPNWPHAVDSSTMAIFSSVIRRAAAAMGDARWPRASGLRSQLLTDCRGGAAGSHDSGVCEMQHK